MSTEFNPLEGLLEDLLSTWDEEPGSEPPTELADLPAPSLPALPFISALVRPAAREPLVAEVSQAPVEVPSVQVAVPAISPVEYDVEYDVETRIKTVTDDAPAALAPVAAAERVIEMMAEPAEILPVTVPAPVWGEDAGAAAACAVILARMEREFAESEPAPLPVRRSRLGSDAPRYVVFAVREMLFAVPIERVLETDRMTPITPLPGAAPGVKGLTNLRGEVVSVIDLREVLGWAPAENSPARRMLVIQDGNRQPLTALLVDQVRGLAAFAGTAWKSADLAGAHGAEGFVDAVTERDKEWVSRLNLDRVLNETHLPSLSAA